MAKQATKAKLLRDLRKSLRQFSALHDAMQALTDPKAVQAVGDELQAHMARIRENTDQLGELTENIFRATLTLDLEPSATSIREQE